MSVLQLGDRFKICGNIQFPNREHSKACDTVNHAQIWLPVKGSKHVPDCGRDTF